MESFYLKDLIKAVNGKFLLGDPNMLVKSISIDSRTVKKGQLYIAIKGNRFDGHDFIKDAVEREASGIIYSRDNVDFAKPFPHFPSIVRVEDTLEALGNIAKEYRSRFRRTKVAGLTGSNGKTTTKEILASIFSQKDKTMSNKGNFNNRIGLPLSVFELSSDIKYAVFEMGTSIKGEIKTLAGILKPDVGIITNIGFSHMQTFESPQGVFDEKRALFDNVSSEGFVVVNNDDEFLKKISPKSYSKVITFALYGGADVYAKNISMWSEKPRFELCANGDTIDITMPVKGRFNVLNALAAATAAIGLDFKLQEVKDGIENFTPPEMRMETRVAKNGETLINDAYNANPSSVREAIQGVCESYIDGEINLVIGDMLELGEKSPQYHMELGYYINSQRIKAVYLIGEMTTNTKAVLNNKNVFHAKDTESLIKQLEAAQTNDKSVFLFKGSRGMQMENIYNQFFNFLNKRKK